MDDLLKEFDNLCAVDRFQKFDELQNIVKTLETRYVEKVDVITFELSHTINGNQYQPIFANEFYHLVLDYIMRSYPSYTGFNYLRCRSDPVFIEVCKTLFSWSTYKVKTHLVPFNKTLAVTEMARCEVVELKKSYEYEDLTISRFPDPEQTRLFLAKLKLIGVSVLETFHSAEYMRWVADDLLKLCKARGIKTNSMDFRHVQHGYYFIGSSDIQWFRKFGDYYVDKINKLLKAIDELSLHQITESATLHAGDAFICEHLLDLYELQQEKLLV